MKLDQKKPEEIQVVSEKEQRKELKKLHSIKVHPGHTLFEVETATLNYRKAEFESVEISYNEAIIKAKKNISFEEAQRRNKTGKKVIVKPGCIYISALNVKNVLKILIRDYGLVVKDK